jgi:mannosyltransferase
LSHQAVAPRTQGAAPRTHPVAPRTPAVDPQSGHGLPPDFDAPRALEHPDDLRPATDTPHRRKLGIACAIVIALITGTITSYQIGHRQLWQDEYSTWYASTLKFSDFVRLISHVDLSVAPYYLFMHPWIALFGDSPAALRAPSALSMAIAAGLIVLLGQRLFDLGTGVLAGLLFAVLPTVSRYAQEARPYAFATLLAVLATLLLVRAIQSPTWPNWLWYGIAMLALGYTHMIAITLALPHFLAVRSAVKRHDVLRLWRWLAAGVAMVVLVVPYALSASSQSVATAWIKVTFVKLGDYPADLTGSGRIAAGLAILGLLGVLLLWRSARVRVVMLATWMLLPPLVAFAGGQKLHVFLFRYFLFTLPAWTLLAAAGLTAIVRIGLRATGGFGVVLRFLGTVALVAAVAFLSLPVQKLYRLDPLEGTFPNYRAAAATIIAGEKPGDAIAYGGDSIPRRALTYELRNATKPHDVFMAATSQSIGQYADAQCKAPVACLGSPPRMWLVSDVLSSDPYAGFKPAVASLLASRYHVLHLQQFTGVQVALLVANPK